MRTVATLGMCLLFALCGGCLPNQAVFKQNNIQLEGTPALFAKTKYQHVSVGTLAYPYSPYDGTPEFRIRLDSGRVVSSRELTPDLVGPGCQSIEAGSRFGGPENSRVFFCTSYSFTFIENRLIELSAGTYPNAHPAFGRAGTGPLYEFPLTSEQATEIFGKADQEFRAFRW